MNVILTDSNLAAAQPQGRFNESGALGVQPAAAAIKPDSPAARVVKLVPGEAIAGYTALLAICKSVDGKAVIWPISIAFIACTVVVVLAIRSAGRQHAPPVVPPGAQYVVSVLAFWAWALTIRDPFTELGHPLPGWVAPFACILIPVLGGYLMESKPKGGS